MTTNSTDVELQLDAVLDDKGRVADISIKH